MQVFFILSGFVLPLNFFKNRKPTSVTGGTFRRYLRLMLPVLMILSLYYLASALDLVGPKDGMQEIKTKKKTFGLLIYDSTISTWYGDKSWAKVTWTLSIELFATFYVYLLA